MASGAFYTISDTLVSSVSLLASRRRLWLCLSECRTASCWRQRRDVGTVTGRRSVEGRRWPRRSLFCGTCDIVGDVILWLRWAITAALCYSYGNWPLFLLLHFKWFCFLAPLLACTASRTYSIGDWFMSVLMCVVRLFSNRYSNIVFKRLTLL